MKRFVVATNHRSGSTLLCNYLIKLKVGCPREYFHRQQVKVIPITTGIDKHFKKLVGRTSVNDIFGMKIHWSDMKLAKNMQDSISNNFDYFISLRRKNVIKQAISHLMGDQRDQWILYDKKLLNNDILEYSHKEILRRRNGIMIRMLEWEQFFAKYNINPIHVTYEDLCENPVKEINKILFHMDMPLVDIAPKPDIVSLSNEINQEWYERFLKDQDDYINENILRCL